MRRFVLPALVGALALLAAGCGGGGGGLTTPVIGAAKVFHLSGFAPAGGVTVGKPVTVSFTVEQPDGKPLTQYKTGTGPHTGVHLIIVRGDLAYIIHEHPPVSKSGLLRQIVTFPAPGPYRVLVDLYPNLPGVFNFQLFASVTVAGGYHPIKLPPFKPVDVVDGYRFAMATHPALHALEAQFMHVDVTAPNGAPVHFVPWFGALAHAIFFHSGSLDYFHTHICSPSAPNCGTLPGVPATKISGRATAPGKLTIGALVPVPGTWRLFLQLKAAGRILTAPYTLTVR